MRCEVAQLFWVRSLHWRRNEKQKSGIYNHFRFGTRHPCSPRRLDPFRHRIIDDVLYDNYHHYLQCEDLPEITVVESAVAENQDIIREIEGLSEGQVTINVDASSCPGRGSIVIYYPSHAVREQIEDILDGRTFYDVPITLINQ